MSEAEVHALFARPFPRGFAGQDVLAQIAAKGWELSPLLACFHPSLERVYEERLLMHRNLEELRRLRRRRYGSATDLARAACGPRAGLRDDLFEAQGPGIDY